MATLIQKYVKYPNDYLMNTMFDDTENKESVKSICKFLEEDLGLVQTSDTGQMNHNTIQSINVKDIYDKSTTRMSSVPFRYGYKVYTIEDSKGMDPLYLKLTFGLQDMSFNTTTNYRSYTTLVIELELYGSTNGAGLYGGTGINQYYKTGNTNVPPDGGYQVDLSKPHYNIISDSYGFYDKSNGRLFICLFPYSRSVYYSSITGPSLRFGIYLEKVTDNSVLDNVLYNTNFLLMTNTNAVNSSYQRTSLLYLNQKYGYTASSTSFDYKPANYNYNYFNTNTVSKSMVINPITQSVTYTDTILFCDKFLVRPFTVIKVKDKNNLETDYFAMTCDALNSYASNTNNAWLIKI